MTDEHEEYELLRVTDVEYLHDYTMLLEFSNGQRRIVDFEPLMKGRYFFEELLDPKKFIQFYLRMDTLEWYNGVDFDPDYLYENSKPAPTPYTFDSSPLPTAAEEPAEYGRGN